MCIRDRSSIGLTDELDPFIQPGVMFRNRVTAIGRSIVDNHDLDVGIVLVADRVEALIEVVLNVVDRHDDAEERAPFAASQTSTNSGKHCATSSSARFAPA